jgi:ferric-chelate reductase (NADPH)
MTSLSSPDTSRAARRSGLMERAITKLLMRPARVVAAEFVSEHFRFIDVEGEALTACDWSAGDKVQVKLDGGLITRTYTPIGWDKARGRTRFLTYCHGAGPGGAWARSTSPGDQRHLFGPRSSLDLRDSGVSPVLVGDETSFALAACQRDDRGAASGSRFVFEVNSLAESRAVLGAIGIVPAALVERRDDDGHLAELCEAVSASAGHASIFVLTGKAQSIQQVSRALKAGGIDASRLRTKAYWAPGKLGLD